MGHESVSDFDYHKRRIFKLDTWCVLTTFDWLNNELHTRDKMKLNNLIGVVLEMTLSINFYHLIQSLGTMERTLDRYL